jgi:hypothetical protein
LFELLNLVYLEIIKLSYERSEINVELYLAKRKKNNKKLVQLNEIDDVLAMVNYKMKKGKTILMLIKKQ